MRVALVDPSRTVIKMVSRILEAAKHDVVAFIDPREALDGGADEFIGKPPFPEELYARLRAGERLLTTQRELVRLATTDPLTGLLNRRACFDAAKELCARAEAGSPLCAVMLDIDHFKRINDEYGHDIGDRVLCGVAHEAATDAKVAARLGGEEFALLIEAELANAIRIAESLRVKVAALQFKTNQGTVTPTVSLGVSSWKGGDSIDTLLKRADMGLYEAKTGGRNRVVGVDPAVARPDGPVASGVLRSGRRQAPSG